EGIPKEDILAGVHRALADKIVALSQRVGLEPDAAVSGGGGRDTGLIQELEARLGLKLLVPPQPQLVNALGAAIIAEDFGGGESPPEDRQITRGSLGGEL
ncbi:MAG: BadF/BadG/BcrA/BcrD ATPase family protein, partial [Chloroflexota bacterium]